MALSDKWAREVYLDEKDRAGCCNLTFAGVYEKCYLDIAYYWRAASTKKKNESSYENVILPALANHNDKRISDYTREDFEEAIELIKKTGYNENGVIRFYAESSIKNFERLIYYVVFQAAVRGFCDNMLWGTHFEIEDIKVEERIYEKVQLKKSLNPKQEKALVAELLDKVDATGEEVGVLLMLALGTRNAEVCGLNYGDIKQLQEYPEDVVAWIYKSTIPESPDLQSSGKTHNAGRIVPIPQKVVRFLAKRKELLMKHLTSLGVEKEVDITMLPIVCKGDMLEGDSYKNRASAREVSNAAKKIFQYIGVDGLVLAFLEEELLTNEMGKVLREKDPTAYLLRRNYATHLQILALTVSEIQYLIGHEVEDAYESRNEFVDEKRIHEMARKLSKRPLLNDIVESTETLELTLEKDEQARIMIEAQEPLDKLEITVVNAGENDTYSGKYYIDSVEKKFDRCIDISKIYHKAYH